MSTIIKRLKLNREDRPSFADFIYVGNQDPVQVLNKDIARYVGGNEFYEFIDGNLDNPWTRIIIKDIHGFNPKIMTVEGRRFLVHELYDSGDIQIVYLVYDDDQDTRPNPIMELATWQFANGRSYNHFIDSNLSDLWSRIIIIGINKIPQEPFTDQKL